MNEMRRFVPLALVAMLGVAAAGGTAIAAESHGEEGKDAALLANSQVTLSQAIAAAEQSAGGKAIGAGVDNENGRVSIAVDVATGAKGVQTVLVDPQTGQVTGTKAPGQDGDTEQQD